MKAVIDGKRYDTERATLVAEATGPYNRGDFHWWSEELYLTAKGMWFLAGEGGAMSSYAEKVPGGMGGGQAIRPLTAFEARRWLEEQGEMTALEEHFAEELEDA